MRKHRKLQQRLASHFPSLSGSYDIDPNFHMFVEDLHLAIMPIGGTSKRHTNFNIIIEGNNNDCKRALALCESLAQYERRDVIEVVCDAVDQIALHIGWHGRAVHEIVRNAEDKTIWHLKSVTPKNLYWIPKYYVQMIPKKDYQYYKKRLIIVPTSSIWEVSVPHDLGGLAGYKKIISGLKRFKHLVPEFWRIDLEKGIQTKNFNFQKYVLNTEIYHTKITRRWGWNRRDYSQRNCTEFFTLYKGITFRWAQAILREHIVAELNKLLSRLQIQAKLLVSGIPTSDEILKVREELTVGKINFNKALDLTSL